MEIKKVIIGGLMPEECFYCHLCFQWECAILKKDCENGKRLADCPLELEQAAVISMLPIEFLGWCIDKGIAPVGKDAIEVPHLKGEMAIPVMTRAQLFDVFMEERGNY